MSDVQFHEVGEGRRIAYRYTDGKGPTLVFLPGYMSDMDGGKATSVFERAKQEGRACLLLDYSGCGQSSGEFADGSLSQWRDEVLALIDANCAGQVIVIGSSMGGWLMLLVGEALGNRLAGLVGIAAAPDFADWGYSDEQKVQLAAGETIYESNPYGPEPTPTHAKFWQDAMTHIRLTGQVEITAPARLLHGQNDNDVPWNISMQLAERLRSDDIQIALVKDGDHRLSRDADIALLLRQVWSILETEPT
ncbi:MAG: alpha/beta hydrolase [Altererythrobacter sp.]|nr:alpha/beta hydrolase [Altererythrobacter sp.]